MKQTANKILLFSFMCAIYLASCGLISERETKVKIESDNFPVFHITGSGTLGDFVIFGPKQRDIGSDRNFAVWEIMPINGYLRGQRVEEINSIRYGEVPKGYEQIYPENNAPPPSLLPEKKYEYWFQTINAGHARGFFEIRNGKAMEVAR